MGKTDARQAGLKKVTKSKNGQKIKKEEPINMYPGALINRLKSVCLTVDEVARLEEVENAAFAPAAKEGVDPWIRQFFCKHWRHLRPYNYVYIDDSHRSYVRGMIAADTAQPVKHAYRAASGGNGLELREIRNAQVSTYGLTGDQYLYTPQGELLRLGNSFGRLSYTTVGPTKYDRVEAIQGSQAVRKWVEERQAKVKNRMAELQGYLDNYSRVLRRLEPAESLTDSGKGTDGHGGQP